MNCVKVNLKRGCGTVLRVGNKLSVEEIINKIKPPKRVDVKRKRVNRIEEFYGKLCSVSTRRLNLFKLKGISCVSCGIAGKYFYVEKRHNEEFWSLQLYSIDCDGNEIFMTIDHILPKSLGGTEAFNNLQPMCSPCNNSKGNKINPTFSLEAFK